MQWSDVLWLALAAMIVCAPVSAQIEESFCEEEGCTASRLELVVGDDVVGPSRYSGRLAVGDDIRMTVVLDTREGPVLGWSYALAHDPSVLEIRESTCEAAGTAYVCDTDAAVASVDPSLNLSRVVNGPDGERSGFVSAVVLSFAWPTSLPVDQRNSLARMSYRVVRVPQEPTRVRFVSGVLSSGGPPVPIVLSVDLESLKPSVLLHAEIEHVDPVENSVELCTDSTDNDEDGLTDCDDPDCLAISEFDCVPVNPTFVRGDADDSGLIDITDAIAILHSLFLDGVAKVDCLDAIDVDDSGWLDLTDAVVTLEWLFRQGPARPVLSGECESDATDDDLGCTDGGRHCGA